MLFPVLLAGRKFGSPCSGAFLFVSRLDIDARLPRVEQRLYGACFRAGIVQSILSPPPQRPHFPLPRAVLRRVAGLKRPYIMVSSP